MNDLDIILNEIIKEKGGSKDDYKLIMDAIAYHESAGTLDPSIKQIGGGPGRGKYQFEIGKHEGGITAAKRTKKYLESKNKKIPEWLNDITKNNDLDVSSLNSDQQDILFLGNMRMHPRADFKNVINQKESLEDFWANYHWAGSNDLKPKKIESFKNSFDNYTKSLQNEVIPDKNIDYNDSEKELNNKSIDNTSVFKPVNYNSLVNKQGFGGMNSFINLLDKNLNEFGSGGSHEVNPYGGIPQGIGKNGKQNTVEEGETSFKIKGSKFIFSDRINTNGKITANSSTNNYFLGGIENTEPKKINPTKVKNDALGWLLNPTTNNRLKSNLSFIGKDPNDSEKLLSKGITNIQNTKINNTGQQSNTEANYANGLINIHKAGENKEDVLRHEYSHAAGLDKPLSEFIRKKYGSPFENYRNNLATEQGLNYNKETYKFEKPGNNPITGMQLVRNSFDTGAGFSSEKQMMNYLNNNGELYPRFQEMRQFLQVNPGDEITDDHIKSLINNKDTSEMFKYYKPEVIKQILNEVASNNNKNKYQGLV